MSLPLPAGNLSAIQLELSVRLGQPVSGLQPLRGGYSSSSCWRARLHNGLEVVIKRGTNEKSARALHREVRAYQLLQEMELPLPPILLAQKDLLVSEYLGEWELPSQPEDFQASLDAIRRISAQRAPLELMEMAEVLDGGRGTRPLNGWQRLGAGLISPEWLQQHRYQMSQLAAQVSYQGERLVHLDTRCDNLILRGERARREGWVIDWSWACRGVEGVDEMLWAVSLATEGILPSWIEQEVFSSPHNLRLLAGFTGYWACMVLHAPAGSPLAARDYRRRNLQAGLRVLCARLGIPVPALA